MQKKNKKFLGILACASALATTSVFSIEALATPKTATVQAARTSVAARSYGVDVSSYQSSNIASTAQAGAQFAIVKVTLLAQYQQMDLVSHKWGKHSCFLHSSKGWETKLIG